jgi:alkaline phosphatase D
MSLTKRHSWRVALPILVCGASIPVAAAVLTDGPLVGAVDHQSAKVFARTDVSGDVQILYRALQGPCASTVATPPVTTYPASDFTVIVALTELCGSTQYSYNILVDGVPQLADPEPTFSTFPPPDATLPFTFDVCADLLGSNGEPPEPAPIYAWMKSDQPAFVLQIGDFDHRNPEYLWEMRDMHREVRGDTTPSGADFRSNIAWWFPVFHVWDDHDYGTDNSDKTFENRAAAIQAFEEYYPIPSPPNPTAGIWHSFRYAQAEFFMLDTRSQRDPDSEPDDSSHSMLDGDNIVNGQKEWLENALLTSTARWKFLVSSVDFNRYSGKRWDSWLGYQTERTELVSFIKGNRISGVVILSADLHTGGMIDDGTNSDFPEMSVPHTNLNRRGDGPCAGTKCRQEYWTEGVIHGNDVEGGYARVVVGTDPDTVRLEAWDSTGGLRLQYVVDCWGSPGEVPSVVASGDKSTLTWVVPSDPGGPVTSLWYDTIRSGSPLDFIDAATCVETGESDLATFDPAIPAPGEAYYYQVRAENDRGEGCLGFRSDGTPRSGRSCP